MSLEATVDFVGSRRFRAARRLGAGGMGVVYEALDLERGLRVALKTLRSLDAEAVLRFKNEFRALQDIQHPNLVTLGELVEEDGVWFFTMELVHGPNLLAWVRPHDTGQDIAQRLIATETRSRTRDTDRDTMDLGGGASPTVIGAAQRERPPSTKTPPRFDETRLRSAFLQLARGLHALHAAKKVHRDIKPSNVLVSAEDGRVVLLDFGLITDAMDVGSRIAAEPEEVVVGTAAYMAPEQATGVPVGPEADWYAVGAVLYRALTGRLPFNGAPHDVLELKQHLEPLAPSQLTDGIPPDLDRLCVELLRTDPRARPSGIEVLRRLGAGADDDANELVSSWTRATTDLFVGRRHEIAELEAAFAEVAGGRPRTIVVYGESGVGKSALVREFLRRVARDPAALVLGGRCYERESVPYKAIDGVIDALTRWLRTRPADEVAKLLPDEVGLLTEPFPVLGQVPLVAQRAEAERDFPRSVGIMHPQERRRRMFGVARALFSKLASARRLVVTIDDLQWADPDGLELLGEILRTPDAPPLLLVATMRASSLVGRSPRIGSAPPDELRSSTQRETKLPGAVQFLILEALPPPEAAELASHLLRDAGRIGEDAATIAREAAGHPLFIDELVRRQRFAGEGRNPARASALHLEDALWERVRKLPETAQRLLEVVVVAGAPVGQEIAAHAAATDFADFGKVAATLRAANLVRTAGARREDVIEPYHDRVREAVASRLSDDVVRAWHGRLALAIEASSAPDAERLAVHWHGAGDDRRAAEYCVEGAARATRALAFDRAARLYRQALTLVPDDPRTREWRIRLGEALANAGRGGEAAEELLRAATHPATTETEALELRRRAGEQQLRSGRIDEGVDMLSEVLDRMGMKLARTPTTALTSLLWNRARLRLRGLKYTLRTDAPSELLARIDCAHACAVGLGIVDVVRGADFQTRTALLALRAGEPMRLARALAMEACHTAAPGGRTYERATRLLRLSDEVVPAAQNMEARGWVTAGRGIVAFLAGKWRTAFDLSEEALSIFRDHVAGAQWEMASAHLFALWALAYLGDLRQLQARVPAAVEDALRRGDVYAATNLRTGSLNFVWLSKDEPDEARHEALEAMRIWSRRGFYHQHWDDLLAQTEIDLYEGDVKSAWQRVSSTWKPLKKSLLLMVQISRIEAYHLRARSAMALAATLPNGSAERKELLHAAARDTRTVENEKMPWGDPLAALLRAALANLGGDTHEAAAHAGRAVALCDAQEMALYGAIARRAQGMLLGGDEGARLVREAERWMAEKDLRNPARFMAMLAPGLPTG
jgi:serine/threonine protein kinase/tetratricopeptide (TPR) repeat protein